MKTNFLTKGIIATVLIIGMMYLCGSWVSASFDIRDWYQETRGVTGTIMVVIVLFVWVILAKDNDY